MDLLKNQLSKKSNLELTKKIFKLLHCCKDKSFSDVCEVRIQISSTALRRYRETKTSSAKKYMFVYKIKQWSFYTRLMSAKARLIIEKIFKTRKTEIFGNYWDTNLIWNLWCESFLLFCIQPDLQICWLFWSYIWQSEITIEPNNFVMNLSFRWKYLTERLSRC